MTEVLYLSYFFSFAILVVVVFSIYTFDKTFKELKLSTNFMKVKLFLFSPYHLFLPKNELEKVEGLRRNYLVIHFSLMFCLVLALFIDYKKSLQIIAEQERLIENLNRMKK